jgi:uncharacterized protein YuzE
MENELIELLQEANERLRELLSVDFNDSDDETFVNLDTAANVWGIPTEKIADKIDMAIHKYELKLANSGK